MEQVDAVIRQRLASDVALINQIAHYIISATSDASRWRITASTCSISAAIRAATP